MKSFPVLFALLAAASTGNAQQYIVSTVAGQGGSSGWSGDGGPALQAQFTNPLRVAVDSKGNLYVDDYSNYSVREVFTNGTVDTVAGNGALGFSGDNGPGHGAQLSNIHDVVVAQDGTIYIADTLNARVRAVSPTGTITTYAGNGARGFAGDGGSAADATLYYPSGLALDTAGNLYIADPGNASVRKVTRSTGKIDTIAGTGYSAFGAGINDGGPARGAFLQMPFAVGVDNAGNVYIGDIGTSSIRKVGTDGKISTYITDFVAQNFAMDAGGSIYFADYRTNTVQKVLPGGTRIWIAGNGISGYSGDGGLATAAQFSLPYGVAVDSKGNVFVADAGNAVIRRLAPVAFSIGAVANAASNIGFAPPVSGSGTAANAIAPGEIIVLFGTGLGPASLTVATPSGGFFPKTLAGTTVLVNGIAAPMIYTSATQVAAVVPYAVNGLTSAEVKVQYQNVTSSVSTLPVIAASPAVFTANSTGSGQAAALNQNLTLNSAANPAHVGETVILYLTGEGQTTPGGVDAKIATDKTLPAPVQPVSVTIGGLPASIAYAGAAPQLVAGVMQLNVQIPSGFAPGSAVPVVVQIGGVKSPAVTIAVSQ